jgi:tRNA threonylcarbamoyladenosine biosynthesis protein TsaE
MQYFTSSVDETRLLGAKFSRIVKPGDVVVLDGGLGCGKTEFVRGFAESLDKGIDVHSPSFSIVNTYLTLAFPVYHFDFYRLEHVSELTEIGFDEYCGGSGVCLIEWGLMFPAVLPEDVIVISFMDKGKESRIIEIPFTL